MHKEKKFRSGAIYIGMFLVFLTIACLLIARRFERKNAGAIDTIVSAKEPNPEISKEELSTMETSNEEFSDVENTSNYALELKVSPNRAINKKGIEVFYGVVEAKLEEFNQMSREEYHEFIDKISTYNFDYFTVVLDNGQGLVYHPKYASWALYGILDEHDYIKKTKLYIDARSEEVETIPVDESKNVQSYIKKITSSYKEKGWYKVKTQFLYDNIYEVKLQININSNSIQDAKAAISSIEQNLVGSEYQLNLHVTCVNEGKEVLTMSFGEEFSHYTFIENGHRVLLDSLK